MKPPHPDENLVISETEKGFMRIRKWTRDPAELWQSPHKEQNK